MILDNSLYEFLLKSTVDKCINSYNPPTAIGGLILYSNIIRGCSMNSLESISTKQLVDELCTRAGIKTEIAEPYQDMTVSVNGPAIVIVVTD